MENVSTVWGGSRVKVRNSGDWYAARARAFEHAIQTGHASVAIMVGTVFLVHKPHWNGLGKRAPGAHCSRSQQHGLWMYLQRLTVRYGHAYVPPVAWAAQRQLNHFCNPTIPMVAAYQVRALQSLKNLDMPLGKLLCGQGYDSFTVSDYFYDNLGDTVLDEPGSATTWKATYERAVDGLLGLHKTVA